MTCTMNSKDKAEKQGLTCTRDMTSLVISRWASVPNPVIVATTSTNFARVARTPSWLCKVLAHVAYSAMSFTNRNNLQAHIISIVAFHPEVFRLSYFPQAMEALF
jgi:hypothetical protein